ncbi:unnamed protein product [Rotaria sp. Silwood1]|nr:unnamed protein product [Rotaria sp. Silwood1]CAF5027650.1 unnamed protein product [Rotaria sp. Silwood1]
MKAGGFQYTGVGDTARCDICGLEVSRWIREMDPFYVHLERNPNCSFVRSVQSKDQLTLDQEEKPAKRQKSQLNTERCNRQNKVVELDILKQARQRTFSHWPHDTALTKEQMISAGFFQCNVGDRVICLYCNLICQQWEGSMDEPVEVHKKLSPMCPYVRSMLTQTESSSVLIVNEISKDTNGNQTAALSNTNHLRFEQLVYTSPSHISYSSIPSRRATFETWTDQSSPSVDDLVTAGFFYTGVKNIVRCFYCNGSLQNWGKNDNPLIEHIRWFPHCAYAKQLSGDELYNKVQKAKRIRQEHEKTKILTNLTNDNSSVSNHQQLQTIDEKLLARLVAARLDLPISQRLLDQNFKLSIIKRCWEDQLQLKHDDFVSDCDLFIACVILQKQIEHINGNKDKIIVPSIKMRLIRDREQSDNLVEKQLVSPSLSTTLTNDSIIKANDTSVRASSVAEPMNIDIVHELPKAEEPISEIKPSVNNPCVMCWQEEKRLACIPCGHLAACVNSNRISTDEDKKALFLWSVGDTTYNLLESLISSRSLTGEDTKFIDLNKLLDAHYDATKNSMTSTYDFYSCYQKSGQTFAQWKAELCDKLRHCGFTTSALKVKPQDHALRDMYVIGIKSQKIRQALL